MEKGCYLVRVFDGFSRRKLKQHNTTYDTVCSSCALYPPGYIWHIEPLDHKEIK